ncbi:uncharacterized protein LOC121412772 [Lytechinus variegatus]|uniref:uncharacterized protein LOC121412772 n=1 Tax=Lytechinus variegatus TaxID=7654 RepID=UPI001BB10209|nr:uncharacterized protein LOC121412772 [Lytechinus variegatus]
MAKSTFLASTCMILVLGIICGVILQPISGCSCGPGYKDPAFCSFDFGINGTVVDINGNVTLQEDLVYSVNVHDVYRNTSEGIFLNEILDIRTSATSCGFHNFEIGNVYLIAGGFSGVYTIESCYAVVIGYNDDGEPYRDVDIPCSTTSVTIASSVVVISFLFTLLFV